MQPPVGDPLPVRLSASTPNLRSGASTPGVGSGASASSPFRTPAAGRPSNLAPGAARALSWQGRNPFPGTERKPRLLSAVGTGGYHFWSDPEDDFGLARHEASEARKLEGRKRLDVLNKDKTRQAFDPSYKKQDEANVRPVYEINGKMFSLGKDTAPPPEQNPKTHWLCQVNGMTGRYNIVNNLPEDLNITRKRDEELRKIHERNKAHVLAGQVQPIPPIACYEMRSFVPIKHRNHLGQNERHYSLFS